MKLLQRKMWPGKDWRIENTAFLLWRKKIYAQFSEYRKACRLCGVRTVDLAAILKTSIHTHTVHIITQIQILAGKSCMILTTLTVNRALTAPLSFLNQPLHTVIRTSLHFFPMIFPAFAFKSPLMEDPPVNLIISLCSELLKKALKTWIKQSKMQI